MVANELDTLKIKKIPDPQYIRKGIKQLEDRKDIIIRAADKGGGIVLMTKKYYTEEMGRLLADKTTYHLLTRNSICEFKSKLELLIKKGVKILNEKEAQFLIPSSLLSAQDAQRCHYATRETDC